MWRDSSFLNGYEKAKSYYRVLAERQARYFNGGERTVGGPSDHGDHRRDDYREPYPQWSAEAAHGSSSEHRTFSTRQRAADRRDYSAGSSRPQEIYNDDDETSSAPPLQWHQAIMCLQQKESKKLVFTDDEVDIVFYAQRAPLGEYLSLLEQPDTGFRLGYATMVLKIMAEKALWSTELERQVVTNKYIWRCMTVLHYLLQQRDVEDNGVARNLCGEVLSLLWKRKGESWARDEISYTESDRREQDWVSCVKTLQGTEYNTKRSLSPFHRGMLVAENDHKEEDKDEDKGGNKDVYWALLNEERWKQRYNGSAWQTLEEQRRRGNLLLTER